MSREHGFESQSNVGDVQVSLDKKGRPDHVLVVCDFKCSIDVCSRKFMVPASFPEADFLIARPILFRKKGDFSGRRHVIPFEPDNTHQFQGDIHSGEILPINPFDPVIQVQKEIMEKRGHTFRVMEYLKNRGYSPTAFSDKFRKAAGITLKSFANKIRLCHALWDLLVNHKAIKSIALDFGYDPISFSLKFFKTFNVWPSEVRKTAGSWSDVLENRFISPGREHARSKIILSFRK
ncbi:MAG: helix-turn-helix domain-containing protein [Acidobacteriota bacterium]|nr:helix-turn-helix domain-containing protein [Acidobacteriota bacterium]